MCNCSRRTTQHSNTVLSRRLRISSAKTGGSISCQSKRPARCHSICCQWLSQLAKAGTARCWCSAFSAFAKHFAHLTREGRIAAVRSHTVVGFSLINTIKWAVFFRCIKFNVRWAFIPNPNRQLTTLPQTQNCERGGDKIGGYERLRKDS